VFKSTDEYRNAYTEFLITRIEHSEIFINEARHAAGILI
jgi:hypothetical protein